MEKTTTLKKQRILKLSPALLIKFTHLKKLVGKIGLAIISSLITLALLEGFVRIFLPQQLILIRPDVWVPDEIVGWKRAPYLNTTINTGEREVHLFTDHVGHRIGGQVKPQGATYRILALGDSFTEALQVEHEQTMTALLAASLSSEIGFPVEVINAGVGGWSPSQYLLQAKQELSQTNYDLILVFFYLGNDIQKEWQERIPPRQGREIARSHSLRIPRKWNRAELINAVAYPINDFLETRSHLFMLIKNRGWVLLMKLGLSPDYLPEVLLRSSAEAPAWGVTADICAKIRDEVAAETPVLFILLPSVHQVDEEILKQHLLALNLDVVLVDLEQPNRLLYAELKKRGVEVIDTTPALKAAHLKGRPDLYGKVDPHFGPGGHQVVAEFIKPAVLKFISE